MTATLRAATLVLIAGLAGAAQAADLPHLQRNGAAIQLMVDGRPYVALAGELHNSSASSPAYMAPVWDRLARRGVRTVIGTASWDLIEPAEGRYDFTAVDDQIRQAKARDMRLVLIWFGAYKNAESTYAPSWVRRDEGRFPRGERSPDARPRGMAAYFGPGPILNVFSDRVLAADARAFAALMRHIRAIDPDQTVIMVQVENEVGLRGDSRDRSALADAVWTAAVPDDLIRYLVSHRTTLTPRLDQIWGRQGYRETGSWSEVFGADAAAEEVFMAWALGRYVEGVARAGAAEYALPMYANAWLGPTPGSTEPGDYPSGGPVAGMLDVWKAAAPTLALLAPDIYVDAFDDTLAAYGRPDNPVLIPEARFDAGNLFVALGKFNAIGFSPFGIEDGADDDPVFAAYQALNGMTDVIAQAQARGAIRGYRILPGAAPLKETLGGYDFTLSGSINTTGAFGAGTGAAAPAPQPGYGIIIQTAEDQFVIAARGTTFKFSAPDARVEVDAAEEGVFRAGRWSPGRSLNGDERLFLVPADAVRIVRVTLLKRPQAAASPP